ncbi:hypothetical protein NDU88_005219 [Pleurodeles waltl]|uniref:Uncharacterized protein n=1 Tax=Pleurodeles waltl TaxID=8319 RepID=A0AAV7NRL8_PLEWA|nr:hypothetical protein NDU88_005219 [Pleurodeles waltl]
MDFPRLSPPHVYAGRWSAPGSPREFGGKSPPGAPKVRCEREYGKNPRPAKPARVEKGKSLFGHQNVVNNLKYL